MHIPSHQIQLIYSPVFHNNQRKPVDQFKAFKFISFVAGVKAPKISCSVLLTSKYLIIFLINHCIALVKTFLSFPETDIFGFKRYNSRLINGGKQMILVFKKEHCPQKVMFAFFFYFTVRCSTMLAPPSGVLPTVDYQQWISHAYCS